MSIDAPENPPAAMGFDVPATVGLGVPLPDQVIPNSDSNPVTRESTPAPPLQSIPGTPVQSSNGASGQFQPVLDPARGHTRGRSLTSNVATTNGDRAPSAKSSQPVRKRRTSSNTRPAIEPPAPNAQIFRNLLIMEESYRQQWIAIARSRRRHTIFFSVLVMLVAYFSYAVILRPSIYRAVNFLDRLLFLASIITLGLFWLTGLYTKTFEHAPKFIHNSNKGIRAFNVKLVKQPSSWKETILRVVWDPVYASDSGGLIKMVLSPRAFATNTVDSWEIYRHEYWERINAHAQTATGLSVAGAAARAKPARKSVSDEKKPRHRRRTSSRSSTPTPTLTPSALTPSVSDSSYPSTPDLR